MPVDTVVTVPPQAVVKLRYYTDSNTWGALVGSLNVAGTFEVKGDPGARAVLTSFDDDSRGGDTDGDATYPGWVTHFTGVTVMDGGTVRMTDALLVRGRLALTVQSGGSLEMDSSELRDNDYYGVQLDAGATATIVDSTFDHATNGVSVSAGAVATVRGSTFTGGRTGVRAALGSKVVVADSRFEDLLTGVWLSDVRTVVTRSHFERIRQDTVYLDGVQFHDALIDNQNVATDSYVNGIVLRNPVFDDGTVLYSRPAWGLVITNTEPVVNVPDGVSVIVPPGTVVKSMGNLPISVEGDLSIAGYADEPVVFTSWHDDAVGGATDGLEFDAPPHAGDWAGLSFDTADPSTVIGYAVFRYARTAIAVGHLSGMHVFSSVFAYNDAAFTVASTDEVVGPYGDLACIPPYTAYVTGLGNFYGTTGFPGFPFDPGTFAGLVFDGQYKVMYDEARTMYAGDVSLEVPVGGNTIPWAMYECLGFPVFPVTPVLTPRAFAPAFPELAEQGWILGGGRLIPPTSTRCSAPTFPGGSM